MDFIVMDGMKIVKDEQITTIPKHYDEFSDKLKYLIHQLKYEYPQADIYLFPYEVWTPKEPIKIKPLKRPYSW
jgi:hypothetical protein